MFSLAAAAFHSSKSGNQIFVRLFGRQYFSADLQFGICVLPFGARPFPDPRPNFIHQALPFLNPIISRRKNIKFSRGDLIFQARGRRRQPEASCAPARPLPAPLPVLLKIKFEKFETKTFLI